MLIVGWPFFAFRKRNSRLFKISTFITRIATTTTKFNTNSFRHPVLNDEEHKHGGKLGIDSYADTCCSGRHCFVEEFIEGKSVTASGFTESLGSLKNLPIANVLYAMDHFDGTVIILECNNTIYLGEQMDDSLANPIQLEENNVRVDTRPRTYYPDDPNAQSILFEDGTRLHILYDGVLPYLPVRRPTKEEIATCRRLELTTRDGWDPFLMRGSFSSMAGETIITDQNFLKGQKVTPYKFYLRK